MIHVDEGSQGQMYHKTILGNTGNNTGVGAPMGIAVDPING